MAQVSFFQESFTKQRDLLRNDFATCLEKWGDPGNNPFAPDVTRAAEPFTRSFEFLPGVLIPAAFRAAYAARPSGGGVKIDLKHPTIDERARGRPDTPIAGDAPSSWAAQALFAGVPVRSWTVVPGEAPSVLIEWTPPTP